KNGVRRDIWASVSQKRSLISLLLFGNSDSDFHHNINGS
ncbi:MAG: hypothetical protein ACI8Q6_003526, partial [Granulosicoccus sp.]